MSKKSDALALIQSDALAGLTTDKQRLFVIHYVNSLNATDAARKAGYEGDDNAMGVIGHKNLRNAKIRTAVDEFLSEQVMSEAEALNRLGQHARADIGEFSYVEDGKIIIDLQEAKDRGLTHLIRKLKTKTTRRRDPATDSVEVGQTVDLELQDQQSALDKILKAHGTYRDENEVSKNLTINVDGLNVLTQVNVQQNNE